MRLYSYAQRMQILVLKSLERCQMIIDLKTTFKILNGEFYLGQDNSFIKLRPNTHLRGHQKQIVWKTTHIACKFNFFVSRVGRVWFPFRLNPSRARGCRKIPFLFLKSGK